MPLHKNKSYIALGVAFLSFIFFFFNTNSYLSADVVENSNICNTCTFTPRNSPADPGMSFNVATSSLVDSIFLYLINGTSSANQVNSYINKCNNDYSFCSLWAASDNYTLLPNQIGGVTITFQTPFNLEPNTNYFWSVHPSISGTLTSGGSESDVYPNGSANDGDNIADYSFVFQGVAYAQVSTSSTDAITVPNIFEVIFTVILFSSILAIILITLFRSTVRIKN